MKSFMQLGFNQEIPFLEDRSDAACRVVIKKFPLVLQLRIAFLSIGEIGHRNLGRGSAVGAARELPPTHEGPPFPYRSVIKTVGLHRREHTDGMVWAWGEEGYG